MTGSHYWSNTYWPIGLIAASVAFIVPELYALFTDANNTLSDYCWRELHVTRALEISGHGAAWWCSFIAWLLFVAVITLHIWYRGA